MYEVCGEIVSAMGSPSLAPGVPRRSITLSLIMMEDMTNDNVIDLLGTPGAREGGPEEIDHVVVNHDGGHDYVGAALARPVRKEARVNQIAALNFVNAFGGNVLGKLLDDCQGIAGQGCASVRVIFIHEGERTVWLNAIGEVGIAARNQNRSEERRVGKECLTQCRSRWSP